MTRVQDDAAVEKALEAVFKGEARWALLSHSVKANALVLTGTGDAAATLEDLADELSEARVHCAYARLPLAGEKSIAVVKCVVVAWCGESAPATSKAASLALERAFTDLLARLQLPVSDVIHAKTLTDLQIGLKLHDWRM
eukprot:TRINITY_DN17903_c0_g1_i1.p2 TRINITY_DN17903_c0_g1~~TRINITY_DN17903_c0_g1_i1.p2  ORF type:complete len:140 (-),score=52.21 TRINITY_DN17903_c0_g1_i1:34-453(-)